MVFSFSVLAVDNFEETSNFEASNYSTNDTSLSEETSFQNDEQITNSQSAVVKSELPASTIAKEKVLEESLNEELSAEQQE